MGLWLRGRSARLSPFRVTTRSPLPLSQFPHLSRLSSPRPLLLPCPPLSASSSLLPLSRLPLLLSLTPPPLSRLPLLLSLTPPPLSRLPPLLSLPLPPASSTPRT